MNIYEINTEYAAIIAAVEEADGELTPELEASLEINNSEFADKAENYLKAVRNYEAEEAALKEEADRLLKKAKSSARTAERLKDAVSAAMRLRGIDREKFGNFNVSFRKSEKVVVDDDFVCSLPDEYKRVKTSVEVDKIALKAAIKAGESVEGVNLLTTFSLQIK